ncbi:dihydrofolate reductase family protein [Actinokineospora enzanensis]|uniref:dihydrofolate reductase family protein n=1 Tax=Actinokineospora enzanensis TaxID=155975 RepID=UPI00037BB939|nr:dihydrofolate reductase family protein [Actinokineospora enzanensis]
MGKILLSISISLDGFIEGPNREIDWHLVDDELHRHFNRRLGALAGFLTGRVTHELMAGAWPDIDDDPAAPEAMREFARIWLDMPKFVFSRTLPPDHPSLRWNSELIRDVTASEIENLRARVDGDLSLGGPDLAASFLRLGLVDEFDIYVHPILIGGGKPLFPLDGAHVPMRLLETRTFGNGVVVLRYARG